MTLIEVLLMASLEPTLVRQRLTMAAIPRVNTMLRFLMAIFRL
jgi:hypothetical protein